MSVSEDLIDFDIIENQKENIQSLPGGRSARALASMFSPEPLHKLMTPNPSDTRDLNDTMRQEYEKELLMIAESDDPLDIYDRYVRWTLDAYPSAQATPASQLLPLLERATKAFLTSTQYKNDPRYLKLWLSYIRFFSDTPRETFAFLARHNVGEGLALFYEEFAAWLESAGRWLQAEEVYHLGIQKEARPAPRLLRKFNEFQQRLAQRPQDTEEPTSPALPTIRPALAAKIDPFAAPAPRDPQAPRPNSGVGGTSTKSGKQKLQIFSDADGEGPAVSGTETKGWESIGSLADRKKENVMEPKPWVGETLKAGGKKSSTKMAVFRDERLLIQSLTHFHYPQVTDPSQHQVTVNPKGRTERIFVNLEAIYPTPEVIGTELSLEELRAENRGWLSKVWQPEILPKSFQRNSLQIREDNSESIISELSREVPEKLVIARDPIHLDENGERKDTGREGRGRKMKIKEVNETQIIKAKLSSPSGPKMTKRKASKEQTMTLHTKAATDDIYDIFSQPLESAKDEEDEDSDEDDGDMTDGDYTSGGESTGTGRLITTSEAGDDRDEETSDIKSVSEWSEFTGRKHIPDIDEDGDTQASRFTEGAEGDDEDFESIKVAIPQPGDSNEEDELITPVSSELPPTTRTMFVPIPPEDYEPPTRPYRDASQVSQNRLPFMTPIAEKTESSIGIGTVREDKDYFTSNSPCKENGTRLPPVRMDDNFDSSPFREITNEARPIGKIPQPLLTKNPKSTTAASAAKLQDIGPIIKDLQCNPVDEYTRNAIFAALQPPLSSYDGFFDHSDEKRGQTTAIQKFAKAASKMRKNASDKTSTDLSLPPILKFPGTERQYMLKRELGAGAFAPVFLLENVAEQESADDDEAFISKSRSLSLDIGGAKRKNLEALKMEAPPTAWEFYIMRQAKLRLEGVRAGLSIASVYEMHLYSDECYLIEEYRDQGTLLDVINLARTDASNPGGVMDEGLVMFFTVELLRTVESLHGKGILHGDLKADNVLVRLDPLADDEVWLGRYRRDGSGGWGAKGVSLIDFGRGIDMRCFQRAVQFIADWKTGPGDCAEMREARPWTYQIDYHGLAGIIHSMLFGKYIDTVKEKGVGINGGKWRIKEGLKRYWQVEVWGALFELLLNPVAAAGAEGMPCLVGVRGIREVMEEWLEGNCEKGVGLQVGLRKLEGVLGKKR